MSEKNEAVRSKEKVSLSYKITGSGVAVVSSGNFVRSEKVQSGVRQFRELSKAKANSANSE